MQVWQECRVLVRRSGNSPYFEGADVELKQDGDNLGLLYWDDDGPVMFGGGRRSGREYSLVFRSRPRTSLV